MPDSFDVNHKATHIEELVANGLNEQFDHPVEFNTTAAKLSCELSKMTPQQLHEVLQQINTDKPKLIKQIDKNVSGDIAGVQFRINTLNLATIYGNVDKKFCAIE